jgi:hypothetical protein
MDLSILAIILLGIVVLWRVVPAVARLLAQRRRPLLRSPRQTSNGTPSAPVAPSAASSAGPSVRADRAPEPVARAFPVAGLGGGHDAAHALEGRLRCLAGVSGVYVSARTALAYVDFLPAVVTEEQLAQAIQHAGYQVSDASRRFDWRHVPQTYEGGTA